MMACSNAVIVIVYNKKLEDSVTLNTMVHYDFHDTRLVIHNNGPEHVSLNGDLERKIKVKFKEVELINCLSNYPLSKLYNDFIAKNSNAKQFIILDDDSSITDEFVSAIFYNEVDLELPRIISRADDEVYYPIEGKTVVTVTCDLDPKTSYSIGSGLIINNSLVSKFQKHNIKIFDENFALYGVDVSLFRRIYQLINKGEIFKIRTSSYLKHSLSRTEGKESSFRVKERLIDVAVATRRYPSFRSHVYLSKKIMTNIVKFNFDNVYLILNAYFSGMHPRCKDQRNTKG
ncbi:glycosyl transferase [Serratia fonticola]|uniref:Glycosyl transferase n=1 Tax=Serratia fonticola TaxID=47917 RepID=A0ABY9PSR1_SERFO|nr:glycosyl transferase [Serratia fonticola]WMT16482.1 glycosyl transferase [Serratia fonticola]